MQGNACPRNPSKLKRRVGIDLDFSQTHLSHLDFWSRKTSKVSAGKARSSTIDPTSERKANMVINNFVNFMKKWRLFKQNIQVFSYVLSTFISRVSSRILWWVLVGGEWVSANRRVSGEMCSPYPVTSLAKRRSESSFEYFSLVQQIY